MGILLEYPSTYNKKIMLIIFDGVCDNVMVNMKVNVKVNVKVFVKVNVMVVVMLIMLRTTNNINNISRAHSHLRTCLCYVEV